MLLPRPCRSSAPIGVASLSNENPYSSNSMAALNTNARWVRVGALVSLIAILRFTLCAPRTYAAELLQIQFKLRLFAGEGEHLLIEPSYYLRLVGKALFLLPELLLQKLGRVFEHAEFGGVCLCVGFASVLLSGGEELDEFHATDSGKGGTGSGKEGIYIHGHFGKSPRRRHSLSSCSSVAERSSGLGTRPDTFVWHSLQ